MVTQSFSNCWTRKGTLPERPRSTARRARKRRCERMSGLVLPAAASLVDQLDKRVLVILRDGRNLVGVMRSFDQFSNVVLEDAVERRVVIPAKEGVNAVYGDAPLGLYVVRGDSIVLLGEVDEFVVVGHLFWGLWAVNQEASEGCAEHDYLHYATVRLGEFWRLEDARAAPTSGT